MSRNRKHSQQAVGIGLALGAGIGSTTAILAGYDLALRAAWGVGGGIIVGAFLGQLLDRRLASGQRPLVWAFGPALGVAVGAAIGLVGAWAVDAPLTDGLLIGAAAGLVLGVLVGGVLSLDKRPERGGGNADEQST